MKTENEIQESDLAGADGFPTAEAMSSIEERLRLSAGVSMADLITPMKDRVGDTILELQALGLLRAKDADSRMTEAREWVSEIYEDVGEGDASTIGDEMVRCTLRAQLNAQCLEAWLAESYDVETLTKHLTLSPLDDGSEFFDSLVFVLSNTVAVPVTRLQWLIHEAMEEDEDHEDPTQLVLRTLAIWERLQAN